MERIANVLSVKGLVKTADDITPRDMRNADTILG